MFHQLVTIIFPLGIISCHACYFDIEMIFYLYFYLPIFLSDPPGMPYIEGYTEGETIRRGQNIELVCRSRGGNPPAQLIWYRNGEQINMAYRTSTRVSENVYSFTAEATDNKATYRCEASNIMSPAPLKTEVTLTVLCN